MFGRSFPRLATGLATLMLASILPCTLGQAADSFDPATQVGPNPVLPDPQQYLFPPMHLAESSAGSRASRRPSRQG